MTQSSYRIGIDVGGTFTDIVFSGSDGTFITKKLLSSTEDYTNSIIDGIEETMDEHGLGGSAVEEIVHGTTIVTNACIELTGAKVGLITTRGFRDVLEITRGRMPVMYDLSWSRPVPLAPRHLRLEVDERINTRGEIVKPLDIEGAKEAIDGLLAENVESIAVCFLNAPKNPLHEKKIGQLIREKAPETPLSLSTEVMPVIKEYERTSETVVNAYVMPLVSVYLKKLRKRLTEIGITEPLYVMQSNGGMFTPEIAAERPIEIIECGPAAGVVGSASIAKQNKTDNIITFDMGGTTCKASIVEHGEFSHSPEYEVGGGIHRASRLLKGQGYVLRVPSIDIAEIGAGGGSILWIDSGGLLHVGPRSSGAMPGPVCYNRGGTDPTLTDATVVLGYLNPKRLLGGDMELAPEKAYETIEDKVAKPLGLDLIEAAYGAYSIANASMLRAIRAVSSERGRDPRNFILYAFGGAGPMYAVGVSKGLGMKTVVVPPMSGVWSAFGLLCADIERYFIQAFSSEWDETILDRLNVIFERLSKRALSSAQEWAAREGLQVHLERFIDLRYKGQASELSIPITNGHLESSSLKEISDSFETEHEKTYGHSLPGYPLQAINVRMVARIPTNPAHLQKDIIKRKKTKTIGREATETRKAYWGKDYGSLQTPVLAVDQIGGKPVNGPILIDRYDTTVVVPPDCKVTTGSMDEIIININS